MSQTILSDGLGYEGKVTLTLKGNNGRVLSTKTYKNSGTAQLFKFLGYCLIDAYEDAKSLLPCQIMLLYNSKGTGSHVEAKPSEVTPRSRLHSYVQTPTVVSDSKTAEVRVVYSFEISKPAITGPFNQVALYGYGMQESDYKDFSAYYFLTDSTGNLAPENVDLWSSTTVLLVEWELTISNKNTETNNK